MKIVSHNINGLNAYIKNGKLDRLLNEVPADIYCFQEVKCSDEEKIVKLLGEEILNEYDVYSFINDFKKGYAGVSVLMKKDLKPIHVDTVNINNPNISGYAKGRLLVCEFDSFILLNLYSINSGGDIKTKDRLIFDTYLIKYIEAIQKIKPVVICGDLNVCSTEYDYWGNYEKAIGSMPGLMKFEINLFEAITQTNHLVDGFRHIHKNERKYSWIPTRGKKSKDGKIHGWRLDYFLISADIVNKIKDCDVKEKWQEADHSPIILDIDL